MFLVTCVPSSLLQNHVLKKQPSHYLFLTRLINIDLCQQSSMNKGLFHYHLFLQETRCKHITKHFSFFFILLRHQSREGSNMEQQSSHIRPELLLFPLSAWQTTSPRIPRGWAPTDDVRAVFLPGEGMAAVEKAARLLSLNGLFPVYKPKGPTSAQSLYELKMKLLNGRRRRRRRCMIIYLPEGPLHTYML